MLNHPHSSRRENPGPEDIMARQKAHFIADNLIQAADWIIEVSSDTPTPRTHELS
jgi:hypothetical protein